MKQVNLDDESAKNLYYKGIQIIKGLSEIIKAEKSLELAPVREFSRDVINLFILGDKTLLNFTEEEYSSSEYLFNHMVNVMVMSLCIGLKAKYNTSQLVDLAAAAFLHDIGLFKLEDIISQPRALSAEEFNCIKKHPEYSLGILSGANDISESTAQAILQHHERINGKGYPKGLKEEEICDYAKIIAIADIFEGQAHQRV